MGRKQAPDGVQYPQEQPNAVVLVDSEAPKNPPIVVKYVGNHNQGESLLAVPNKDLTLDEWLELPIWARRSIRLSTLFTIVGVPEDAEAD